MNLKNRIISLLIFIFIAIVFMIAGFFVSKNYNKPENIEKRAIENCIDSKYEYRETYTSDGKKLKQCIVNGVFVDVVEFYKNK